MFYTILFCTNVYLFHVIPFHLYNKQQTTPKVNESKTDQTFVSPSPTIIITTFSFSLSLSSSSSSSFINNFSCSLPFSTFSAPPTLSSHLSIATFALITIINHKPQSQKHQKHAQIAPLQHFVQEQNSHNRRRDGLERGIRRDDRCINVPIAPHLSLTMCVCMVLPLRNKWLSSE